METQSVIEGLGFSCASATIRIGVVASAEVAPTFSASSAAGTLGLADTLGVRESAVSSPLERSTSVMTSG
jgi:hypothetical protein